MGSLTVEVFSVVTVLAWFWCILKGTERDWVAVGINALVCSGRTHHILEMGGGIVVTEVRPKTVLWYSPSLPSFSFARDDESEVHGWQCRQCATPVPSLSILTVKVKPTVEAACGELQCSSKARDQNDSVM
jgi:hypothetical protein